ncbi:MAG: PEP-CTERM sorting domain-containing protein [Pirellulales bacterium]
MIVRTVETLRRVSAHTSFASLALAAGAFLYASQAFAAPINYGDFAGATVTYTQVTEDANSAGDAPPLFGPPTVSGDSLDFDPVGFSASATGAGGVDITDGNLRFGIVAKPGGAINQVMLNEAGDTTLAGFGTDATFTAVTARGVISITGVDGAGINVVSTPFSMTFSPSGGTYGLGTDGGGGPLYAADWSGGIAIDVDAILTSKNIPFNLGATKVSINLDNTLIALSQNGTFSLIAKKDFGGLSVTVNIPEPSTVLMLGLASIGLVIARRK